MSKVVSMRLQESQVERLRRLARRLGRTPTEVGALLIEEGMRETEFAWIEFRDSPVGRQAYVKGSTLAVWEVVMVARDFDLNVPDTARNLRWPEFKVQAALIYAAAFPAEIDFAIADNEASDFESLSRALPQAERFTVPADYDIEAKGNG